MDATETSNQHIETTELYITFGDTDDVFVYLCIVIDGLFRAIVVTVDIGYVATAETSKVNIETEEPDIAIGEASETSYVIFDDILFGRLGAMRWPDDRHIERWCETSYLRDVRTSDIRHICGSRLSVQ